MAFEIRYSRTSHNQLNRLRAFDRTAIIRQIENVLGTSPTLTSKARVKRLRQPVPTDFRLRVGDFRVFYNVVDDVVQVVQILSKPDAISYCQEQDDDSPDRDESDNPDR